MNDYSDIFKNNTENSIMRTSNQIKKSLKSFFFYFFSSFILFVFILPLSNAVANPLENETVITSYTYMLYFASIPLTITLATVLFLTYSTKEQWRQWLLFALVLGIVQSILSSVSFITNSQLLSITFNILLSGFILMLWPHIGRHILKTSSTDSFTDKIFIVLSIINAAYTLIPLFPGSNFTLTYPIIWPCILLLVIPALFPAIKAKRPEAGVYTIATIIFVAGAFLPFIVNQGKSIYPQQPWGLWTFAIASLILTLLVKPANSSLLGKIFSSSAAKQPGDFPQAPATSFKTNDVLTHDLQQLFKANSGKVASETSVLNIEKKISTKKEVPFPFNAFENSYPAHTQNQKKFEEFNNNSDQDASVHLENLLNFTPPQKTADAASVQKTVELSSKTESFLNEVTSSVIEHTEEKQIDFSSPTATPEETIPPLASSANAEPASPSGQNSGFNTPPKELPNIAVLKELSKTIKDSSNIQLALSSDFPIQIFEPLDFSDDPDLEQALNAKAHEPSTNNSALDNAIESIVEALSIPAESLETLNAQHNQEINESEVLSLLNIPKQQAAPSEHNQARTLSEVEDPSELISFMTNIEDDINKRNELKKENHTETNPDFLSSIDTTEKETPLIHTESAPEPAPFESVNAGNLLSFVDGIDEPQQEIPVAQAPVEDFTPSFLYDTETPENSKNTPAEQPVFDDFIPADVPQKTNTTAPEKSSFVTIQEPSQFTQAIVKELSNTFTSLLAQARIASLHNDFAGVIRVTTDLAQTATSHGLAPLERMSRCVMRAAEAKDVSAIQDLLPELIQKTENTIIDIQKKAINSDN